MRRAEPSMRTRDSSVAHRPANGALHAVNHDTDAASIEPFDDVNEHGAPNHAHHAHDLNGVNGASEPHNEPLSPDDPLAPLPFNPYKGIAA
jgi:hypothetical protein